MSCDNDDVGILDSFIIVDEQGGLQCDFVSDGDYRGNRTEEKNFPPDDETLR